MTAPIPAIPPRRLPPRHALRVLLVLLVLVPVAILPGSDSPFVLPKAVLLVAGSLALLALLGETRGAPRGVPRWPLVPVAALLGWVALATVLSPDPLHSLTGERIHLQGLISVAAGALAVLAGRRLLLTRPGLLAVASAIGVATALVAGYGLLQGLGADPIWAGVLNKGRIFSTFGQANALGGWLVIGIPFLSALVAVSGGRRRALAAAALLAALIALAWSESRGAWLGLGAATLVTGLLVALRLRREPALAARLRPSRRAALAATILLLAAAIIALPIAARRVGDRESRLVGSVSMHVDLWRVAIRMAADHPLTGVGPERYGDAFHATLGPVELPVNRLADRAGQSWDLVGPVIAEPPPIDYRHAARIARWRPASPHSVPLAIAAGSGLPALAAFLVVEVLALAGGVRRLLGAPPAQVALVAALFAGLLAHLVADLFVAGELAAGWTGWLLAGALLAGLPALRGRDTAPAATR